MQVAAGEHRAREVDFDRCSQLPLPVLKRNCRHRKCPGRVNYNTLFLFSQSSPVLTQTRCSYVFLIHMF